jgi:regulatory protein
MAQPMATAYVDGLKLLARRELSEAQVRQRLARRQHPEDEIEAAVARLKAERAIDDARAAAAIARTETAVRRRGKLRVRRQIESAGIAAATAREAADAVFAATDQDALIAAALERRLRGRERASDDREFRRLHRFLIAQGFEPDRVLAVLRGRRPVRAGADPEPDYAPDEDTADDDPGR